MENNDSAVVADTADDNGYGIKKDYFIKPENKKRKLLKDAAFVFLS